MASRYLSLRITFLTPNAMNEWYCLYTKRHAEYQVAAFLESRDIEVYLPEMPQSGPGNRPVQKPIFPCYLFARINFERTLASKIRWTPGLRQIITAGNTQVVIPDSVIQEIRHDVERLIARDQQRSHGFVDGEPLEITFGPFAGRIGLYDAKMSSRERVEVLLQILGRQCRVELDVLSVERADGATVRSEYPDQNRRPRRPRRRRRH